MKDIKNYLHLYLGCEYMEGHGNPDANGGKPKVLTIEFYAQWIYDLTHTHFHNHRLILRPLASMTDEEMIEVIQLTTPDYIEDKPTAEDYDLDIFYNDGGNMVDGDVEVGANYSCICYEGQIAIRKCGSVHFFNEDGELENAYNMPKVYAYLISKHFDLFGLIPDGLAIDKTTLKTKP